MIEWNPNDTYGVQGDKKSKGGNALMNALGGGVKFAAQVFAPQEYAAARQRKHQNALAGALENKDYEAASSAAYRLGDVSGGLQLAQMPALQAQQQQEQQAARRLQMGQTGATFIQNMMQLPEGERMLWAERNWGQLGMGQILGKDFRSFAQANPNVPSDQDLLDDLLAFRTMAGQAPEQQKPGEGQFTLDNTRYNADGSVVVQGAPEQADQVELLTPQQEVELFGVDRPGSFQRKPDGTISAISGTAPRDPLVTVDNSQTTETAFARKAGELAGNRMGDIYDRGSKARQIQADADMMNALLEEIDYQGFGGNTLLAAQRIGAAVGVQIGDDLGAKEAAEYLTKQLGLALKENLPGPMSDSDREFLMAIPPGINNTYEGNKALIFMMKKRADFDAASQASLMTADPQTAADYRAWERQFREEYGPLFNETTRRSLMGALSGQS